MESQEGNFLLRSWQPDDLDNLVRFANNQHIACNLTDVFPHPYTRDDGIAFIRASQPGDLPGTARIFAIEVNGTACGAIGIFPQSDVHRKNAEIGYWLAEESIIKNGLLLDELIYSILKP
ncbi:MAG: GNAT family N-acetyltransferase [Bacteroidota bacterium]